MKYFFAKKICSILPPIVAQTVRNKIISTKEGESLSLDFVKKSFTGSSFYGNTSDFHSFKFSIHGYFDWRNVIITKTVLDNFSDGDIIEVGANVGTETISFADVAKKHNRQVYAYEPVLSNFGSLERIKKENNLNNLKLFLTIVSNYVGTANFKVPSKNHSGSGHITNDKSEHEFPVVKLDDNHRDHKIGLICMDVEGFEYQVLLGALEIIKNQNPFLILEVNKNYLEERGNITLLEMHKFLTSLNYECYYVKSMGIVKVDIDNFEVYTNKNWLCIPNKFAVSHKKISNSIFWNAINPFVS